ncbi:uncharacterized protein LOC129592431 [Paramacrobiotus metropolitanus]|uniref:uncharacterized protein LOC129592431 n=1 Tax=Paramacrobiotus metropolitanus TaxID=2943436 RepID=UPI00244596A8|nr:uncharacterized protein LOC129592431 [Paramacrobiotus metropolitanus]
MLLYGDEGSVCVWNSVDVLVEGQLQHGRVINVADGGLIIDFQCASQRAQFVAYGRIFRCYPNWLIPTDDVQVLLRRRADAAWLWYPGNVVDLDFEDANCVEVSLPHGTVRELLPWEQVRPPLSHVDLEERRVMPGHFVVRWCRLAVPHWAGVSQRVGQIFRWELQRRCDALCICVKNQTMDYLQRQIDNPLTTEQVEGVYKLARMAKRSDVTSGPIVPVFPHRVVPSVAPLRRKRKLSGGDRDGVPLSVELLVEIFQSLNSLGRVRCRRVSSLWNALLTTDAYFPDVRVSGHWLDYDALHYAEHTTYWAAVCLLKCLRHATKTVVLSHLDVSEWRELTAVINYIRPARRLPVLVLCGCDLGEPFDWAKDVIGSTAQLAVQSGCQRLVWVNCRFADRALQAVVTQHAFRVQSPEAMEVQLWDLLESSLQLQKPLDRSAIAQWIAESVAQQRNYDIEMILLGLWNYQSADPRPATPYRGREWTASMLAQLDATQLTTLTTAYLHDWLDERVAT